MFSYCRRVPPRGELYDLGSGTGSGLGSSAFLRRSLQQVLPNYS